MPRPSPEIEREAILAKLPLNEIMLRVPRVEYVRRRVGVVRMIIGSLRRRKKLLTNEEKKELNTMETEMKVGFQYAVAEDRPDFLLELLEVDDLTPPIIPNETVKNALEGHRCRDNTTIPGVELCKETVDLLAEAARKRRLVVDIPIVEKGAIIGVYGSMPPKPSTASLLEAARKEAQLDVMSKFGVVHSGGPLKIGRLHVEHGQIVLRSPNDVSAAIRTAATIGHGVTVARTRGGDGLPMGLYAGPDRSFQTGEVITTYDGDVIPYSLAQDRISKGHMHIRTLRAGLWAIHGLHNFDSVSMDHRGGASFATGNFDRCASLAQERDVFFPKTHLNAEFAILTNAENDSKSTTEFDPSLSHIILIATRPISPSEEIFVRTLSLSDYTTTSAPPPS